MELLLKCYCKLLDLAVTLVKGTAKITTKFLVHAVKYYYYYIIVMFSVIDERFIKNK